MTRSPISTLLLVVAVACTDAAQSTMEPESLQLAVTQVAADAHEAHNFRTHATGDEEVPANASVGQGQAVFSLSKDGTELHYRVLVANIENVTQSHIHLAAKGVNGSIVAWLYPSAPPLQLIPGRSDGVLGEGIIRASDLRGPLAGKTVADLVAAIRAGNAYVNVHTSQLQPGEIRGQID